MSVVGGQPKKHTNLSYKATKYIKHTFSWIPHITNVARKVSKTVGVMYKASFCLSKRSLFTLYYSLLYPYLQYCVSVWGSTYPSNLNRIFMLQKGSGTYYY